MNKNSMAEATALQVAAMAIGQFRPEFSDPRRLLAAIEAATAPEQNKDPERMLTTEAAAERLSMPRRQVVHLIRTGKLRGVRLGWKTYRVPESAIAKMTAEFGECVT